MWFAALGTYQHNPWLVSRQPCTVGSKDYYIFCRVYTVVQHMTFQVSLAYRLLEGRKEVLDFFTCSHSLTLP